MTATFQILSLAFVLVIGAVAIRDHQRLRARRAALLDEAAAALISPSITWGGDGFPKLRGQYHGQDIHVDLIPDTMVVRRLPQLWMSVTLLTPNPDLSALGMLVRYAGNEFYSLTSELEHRLDPPTGFPQEVLIRSGRPSGNALLNELRQPLAKILADPHVKEVAITNKGLRIVRQAAEGRRGDHLLLRQATFDTSSIPYGELEAVLAELGTLQLAISQRGSARAA